MRCARCEEWQRICENLESQIAGLREDAAARIEQLEAALRTSARVVLEQRHRIEALEAALRDALSWFDAHSVGTKLGHFPQWEAAARKAFAPEREK